MDLLIVPVPIFSRDISVEAYIFRYQQGNEILEERRGPGRLDGAMNSAPLEMLNTVSVDVFTMGKPIFVPIDSYMLLAKLDEQCSQPPDTIVFLLDHTVKTDDDYIESLLRLKKLGFRFAIQKISNFEKYSKILMHCDFVFYDHRTIDAKENQIFRILVQRALPKINVVYTHINTMDQFEDVSSKAKGWFEGRFYRTPITKVQTTSVTPLQVNLINLLNTVRKDDFEFENVSSIIAKDPALSVALLKLVNSAYFGTRNRIKGINQAVTMLGQKEIRKWITTAVSKILGAEKPNEVTRLSLIRARFAENLAVKFGLKDESDSLFLMGLFSVLDTILERPISEALELVHVSDKIYDALVSNSGDYAIIYDFIQQYENAGWNQISRMLIIKELTASDIYEAYYGSLCWYRDILTDGGE